jgi:protein TonB
MKSRRCIQLGICLLLTMSAGWLHAEPRLNGLAVNTEFGKERFIAALYTDNPTRSAEEMLSSTGERRMELRVTADSLSARSVNSMWVEGMAINNPASALENQAENLARLSNLIRRRLRAGDILTFTATPGNGTTVTLNGIRLGVIRSDAFFPMLLRTWIGSIPLSSEFKDSLLAAGDVNADLSARFAAIGPSDARIQAVSTWVAPEPPEPQVADGSGIQPPRPDLTIAPPPVSGPAPAASAASEPEEEEPQVAAAKSAPQPATASASEPQAAAAAEPAPKPQAAAPKPAAQVARAPASPSSVEEEEDEDVEEVMVTAESLLLRQRYISDVMRQTMQNMRYPRRALERGQQGSIRLAVTVGRDGSLQGVQVLEESRHSLLTKEAVASVERASPFPQVPDGIVGESFAFGIPVTFVLQ